jgi:hypothetical protein
MEPIKTGSSMAYTPVTAKATAPVETPKQAGLLNSLTNVEQNKVTLSDEGKQLLAALQKMESDAQGTEVKEAKDKSVGDKVESFTYGALGMDSPDKIKEEKDTSYSAGQYLSGAITAGAILLALA